MNRTGDFFKIESFSDRSAGRKHESQSGPSRSLGKMSILALLFLSALAMVTPFEITVDQTDRSIFTFDIAEYAMAATSAGQVN